jgi:hypothetical protein
MYGIIILMPTGTHFVRQYKPAIDEFLEKNIHARVLSVEAIPAGVISRPVTLFLKHGKVKDKMYGILTCQELNDRLFG